MSDEQRYVGARSSVVPPPPRGGGIAPVLPTVIKTNGMAVASLVCGLTGFLYLIPAILAIVFGVVAQNQIKGSTVVQSGKGMATAGVILGCVWVGIVLLVVATASS